MQRFFKFLLLLCLTLSVSSGFAADKQPVVVIPIEGDISKAMVHFVDRGISTAKYLNASAIIIQMDTYGGTLQAAEEIMQSLSRISTPTYTFINTKAISAGALISASTEILFIAPQSQIGAAKVVQGPATPFGKTKDVNPAMAEKVNSTVEAIVRSSCEKNGHNYDFYLAMIDPDFAISNIVKTGELLTFTSQEAVTNGLAVAQVSSIQQLLAHQSISNYYLLELNKNHHEKLAGFLTSPFIVGLLLMFGIAGIFIELRTPGLGLAGALGVLFLTMFFWGHMLAGLSSWAYVLMFVSGIILVILEIFVIPGFGIAGISGGALILFSTIMTIGDWNQASIIDEFIKAAGILLIASAGALALVLILARFLTYTPIFKRLITKNVLDAKDGYSTFDVDKIHALEGKTGVAYTTLRPGGKVLIDSKIYDVVTYGSYIEQKQEIIVVATEGSRIFVEEKEAGIKK